MVLKTNYVNMSTKKIMVEQIVDNCITYDNDLMVIDYISKEIGTSLALIQMYTEINLDSEDFDLDKLYADGQIDEIKKSIPYSELSFIQEMVSYMIDERKDAYNSVSGVLSRGINKLILKIPDSKDVEKLLKKIPKVLDNLSPENKEIFKSFVEGKVK